MLHGCLKRHVRYWGINMGFKFASFGAATVPLSKIVIDKELNMGEYPIKANPEKWETETLDWGDIPPITHTSEPISVGVPAVDFGSITVPAQPTGAYRYIECVLRGNSDVVRCRLYADGAEIALVTGASPGGKTIFNGWAPAATTYSVTVENGGNKTYTCTLTDKGLYGGPKTFNLTGKWLALGIDMHGLDATVKIQGVEVPYSDYAKYFPLVPTELKIPGNWSPTQERPVIEVYK